MCIGKKRLHIPPITTDFGIVTKHQRAPTQADVISMLFIRARKGVLIRRRRGISKAGTASEKGV